MPNLTRALLALIAFAALLDAQSSLEPDARRIHWQRTLADAEELARATGRPLLLALNMDGESASDRIAWENYRDPRFVALTRRVVCVGASVFRHNARDHDDDGRRVECPRFCGLTCGEHIALEPLLFERYFVDGERVAPRHALRRPDGSFAFDLSLCFDLLEIDRALAAATADLEPWRPAAGDDWATLAARHDVEGRQRLERAIATSRDAAALHAALHAVHQRGDAGALEALRLLLARAPEVPVAELQYTAVHLGVGREFVRACWRRTQQLGPSASALEEPAEVSLLAGAMRVGERKDTALWRCALAATELGALYLVTTPTPPHDPATYDGMDAWRAMLRMPAGVKTFTLAELLTLDEPVRAAFDELPQPGLGVRALAPVEELQQRLQELDTELERTPGSAELLAALGIASLDLARVRMERGGGQTELLLQDAASYLQRATTALPQRYEWWIERARTAYYLQRFDLEAEYGRAALRTTGFDWPVDTERQALANDPRAMEAVNWIADAEARGFAGETFADEVAAVARIRSILLGLGLAAMSPFGDTTDWIGFASFAGALGLERAQLAILARGLRRLPGSGELRQALYDALWQVGRPELAPVFADRAVGSRQPDVATWWQAHARVLLAEDQRRCAAPAATIHRTYAAARHLFATAATSSPEFADSVRTYDAIALLGMAMASQQPPGADRREAARCWRLAVATGVDVRALRDGLGYDALDVVDRIVEWRADGPSPVSADELIDGLAADTPQLAFWATAIGDAALREALRADGRNPERREGETVDAAGRPVRSMIGLPTTLGDRYLDQAVRAGERAVDDPGADDDARTLLAQASAIRAERQLLRGRTDGAAADLRRAAATFGVTIDLGDGGLAALRTAASALRQQLGPARPRLRDGR